MRENSNNPGKSMRDEIRKGFLPVVNRSVSVCIPLEEILYIERDARVIKVATLRQRYRYYESMEHVLPLLDGHFYQSLRGMVVNLRNILEMRDQRIRFVGGESLRMSYKAFCRTKQVYSNYILNGRKGFVHWREEEMGE